MTTSSFKTPSEATMWKRSIPSSREPVSDGDINEKYKAGEQRIVTESNREKLPNFVAALKRTGYMEVRPFYQRRRRWDAKRKSRLIESFIMNIPVPPLFLYEKDFNKYEVMDGQQRINALSTFYDGEFKLTGLEIWPELNGKTYSTLPSQVRSGLDRRSVSYIIVLKESTYNEETATFLRQTVFERLNTGGVKLERQEIRNCLFQGPFNDLILDLTRNDSFRKAWGLPLYQEDEESDSKLIKNQFYQKMRDAELILRFFALRSAEHYTRGMHGFLDLYMSRANAFEQRDLDVLRQIFEETIDAVIGLYSDKAFRPFDPETNSWKDKRSTAFYDAVMIGITSNLCHFDELTTKKEELLTATKLLFEKNPLGTFTGRGNTKHDVLERISKYSEMIEDLIG